MTKSLIALSILLLGQFAHADWSFKLINDGAASKSNDTMIYLGTLTTSGCASPGLANVNVIKEGAVPTSCHNFTEGANRGVDLIVPLRATFTSDGTESLAVSYYVSNTINSFQNFDLKNTRNQAVGGGSSLVGSTVIMNNNDSLPYELELRAIINGPSARDTYDQVLEIDISPI